MAARLPFRSWHGARVGPHRSPILRPRSFSLRFVVISSTPLKLNVQLGQNIHTLQEHCHTHCLPFTACVTLQKPT